MPMCQSTCGTSVCPYVGVCPRSSGYHSSPVRGGKPQGELSADALPLAFLVVKVMALGQGSGKPLLPTFAHLLPVSQSPLSLWL